jgi:hypothetical protein
MKSKNINFSSILIATILLLAPFSIFSGAENVNDYEQLKLTYSFEAPIIEQIMIDDTDYTRITIKDLSTSGNCGNPRLPSGGANILLPQGTIVDDITVEGESEFLGSGFNVEPVPEMIPISKINNKPLNTRNEDIYSSNEMFPGKLFEKVGVYSFRGYEILVLKLHPVQYIPATGELYFYKDIELSVNLIKDGYINHLFRNLEKDKTKIFDKVDNPEIAETYNHPVNTPIASNDLLIITTESLKSGFENLKDFHDGNDLSTVIKTTSDIGSSNPDDIRNYIRNAYNSLQIDYVLIGADDDIIPAKDLFVRTIWWWPWSDTEEHMPSDCYYACLDGTYDNNGNGYYGEPNDGPGGGDVDLVADVYVGRASVGSIEEVNNFVDKTISYLFSDGPYLEDALMVGELLNTAPLTWGGTYMDELIDWSNANGYTTKGIPSNEYNIDKLYEKNGNWYSSDLISKIENGIHFINHLGHANYNSVMKLSPSSISSLTNEELCFIYSQGCMAGGFDNGDCVAEYFTVKTDNAAFAVIMNARYGWYNPGGTDSSSQHYHREFWDAVFNEDKTIIGEASHDSKEDNLYRINDECMRWSYYALNLFGDPTVDFLNHYSNTAPYEPFISGPNSGKSGSSYSYLFRATDPDGNDVRYHIDWGDTKTETTRFGASGTDIMASHIWEVDGTYTITAQAEDIFGQTSPPATKTVTIPRYKTHNHNYNIFNFLFERFQILRQIFGFY